MKITRNILISAMLIASIRTASSQTDKITTAFSQSYEYCTLTKQFTDVFAWEYNNLKIYDTNIIQHKIPLEKNAIPFK